MYIPTAVSLMMETANMVVRNDVVIEIRDSKHEFIAHPGVCSNCTHTTMLPKTKHGIYAPQSSSFFSCMGMYLHSYRVNA